MFFRGSNSQAHCNEAILCPNFGTPENNEFSIWNKWKIYYFEVSQYLSTLGYRLICEHFLLTVNPLSEEMTPLQIYTTINVIQEADLGPITCQCNRLQLQLLSKIMITDYNYNYIFLNVIDYNYNYFAK